MKDVRSYIYLRREIIEKKGNVNYRDKDYSVSEFDSLLDTNQEIIGKFIEGFVEEGISSNYSNEVNLRLYFDNDFPISFSHIELEREEYSDLYMATSLNMGDNKEITFGNRVFKMSNLVQMLTSNGYSVSFMSGEDKVVGINATVGMKYENVKEKKRVLK